MKKPPTSGFFCFLPSWHEFRHIVHSKQNFVSIIDGELIAYRAFRPGLPPRLFCPNMPS